MAEAEPKSDDGKTTYINVPEAVGVFDTFEAQQAAFYDLRSVGFHHSYISFAKACATDHNPPYPAVSSCAPIRVGECL